MLIGRESEVGFLEQYYSKPGKQLVVAYGQRGVGRRTIVEHFVNNKPCFAVVGRQCSGREICYQWAREIEIEDKGIELAKYPSYSDIFTNGLNSVKDKGRRILLIDEFHYLIKNDDDFMSLLMEFYNDYSSPDGLLIVLSSSAYGWVENSMVPKIREYALSISGLLKFKPMRFQDIMKIYPEFDENKGIELYSILGGFPGLWKYVDANMGLKENVVNNILDRHSRLSCEINHLINEELREPGVYNTILSCLSRNINKLNDIYHHTGFSRAKISVYIKNLIELGLVEKLYSVDTPGIENSQKGLYKVADPYVRFYYRYIFPNFNQYYRLNAADFYESYVEPSIYDFIESGYKEVCRQTISRSTQKCGEWLGKMGALDLITKSSEGEFAVGFCSYDKMITEVDVDWVVFCSKQAGIEPSSIMLFGEKGFSEDISNSKYKERLKLYTLFERN